jgi:hypothetical protein
MKINQLDNMYHFVDDIPADWAWQIVGELGKGYRDVTPGRVLKCLTRNKWLKTRNHDRALETKTDHR